MSIKFLFVIIFIFIIISLISALFHLVKHTDKEQSGKTAKALTYRIGLSLVLFIMLFIAYSTGLIKSEGIGSRIHKQNQINLESSSTR